MKKVKAFLNAIICIIGACIMGYLSWHALTGSQYMIPGMGEVPIAIPDSAAVNLLFLILFLALLITVWVLLKKYPDKSKPLLYIILAASTTFQLVFGFMHIFAADRIPKGDQGTIYYTVLSFIGGDYNGLGQDKYFGMYPQQLGQAFFEQLLLTVFKKADYHLFQVILVFMSAGIVICVYSLIKDLTGNAALTTAGTLVAGFNFLTVFYDSWIYGDLPSAFLCLASVCFLVKYHKKKKKTVYLVSAVLITTLSVLLRQNTFIFVIACAIVLFLEGVFEKDKKLLLTCLLIVLLPVLAERMVYAGYEKVSGISHSDGLPAWHYFYIGMTISEGRCGWYSYLPMDYYAHDCDTKETGIAMKAKVMTLLHDTWNTPGYFKTFYSSKILSQWNEPLFQSVFYNAPHEDVRNATLTSFFDLFIAYHFDILLFIADRIQFIIYFGMFLYCVLSLKDHPDILEQIIVITLIGGFIFSIIWEAKARYCFPYYIMMFPMALQAHGRVVEMASCAVRRLKKK